MPESLSPHHSSQIVKGFFLSDESRAVFIWNSDDGLSAKFDLPWTKAEGIAVNKAGNVIFISNDSLNTISEYQFK